MDVSEYMRISDWQERERAREAVGRQSTKARASAADLLAAEAAVLLLGYFEDGAGNPPVGDARPAYVDFDFDPEADGVTGAGSDIRRVYNAHDAVIWSRYETFGDFDFDGDVTDFLTGAMEADPSYFLEIGEGLYRYSLPG